MKSIRKGLFAGLLAGLLLALLYFVDYGPGVNLHTAAKWFALDSRGAGGLIGFVLLIVLGGLFGAAFGVFQRGREVTLGRAMVSGLILGVVWLVILVFLLGSLVGHVSLGLYGLLLFIATSLLYGLVVGMVYFQSTGRGAK